MLKFRNFLYSSKRLYEYIKQELKTLISFRVMVHGWCAGGARVVHGWCMGGAWVVHGWCTGGAWVVHGWCVGGARVVHRWQQLAPH